MSHDFLHNIFSRGSFARTDSPIVSVGGVSSNSGTLTYDVLHFDTTGALIVSGGGSGTATSNVVASQSGSWTVAVSGGTMSVLWAQRLDATNDAITVYQNVSNSNWTVIASQSGSWTFAGTMTALVSAGTMSAISLGQARTADPAAVANAALTPMITDSLGKQVVLPGAVNDLHLNGQVATPGVLSTVLITNQGAGKRIAMQSIIATGTASALANVIIAGGPNIRTFGLLPIGYGGFAANAGGAPLYLTSASAALSVYCDSTVICNIFASGYSLSN